MHPVEKTFLSYLLDPHRIRKFVVSRILFYLACRVIDWDSRLLESDVTL